MPKKSPSRISRFESLETRQLLAGNVAATLSGGLLTLSGDAAANNVQISQLTNGDWLVKGIATKINGANSQPFSGVTDITVDLVSGQDVLKVSNGTLTGDLNISFSGGGNKTVQLSALHASNFLVESGAGNDSVVATNLTADNVINFDLNAGNDTIVDSGLHAGGSILAFVGTGKNAVSINNCTAVGEYDIDARGTNAISVANSTTGDELFIFCNGSSTIAINNVTAATSSSIFGGAGANVIAINKLTVLQGEEDINTGPAADAISIVNSHFGQNQTATDDVQGLYIQSGLGSDTVSISNTTVVGHLRLDTSGVLQPDGTVIIPIDGQPFDGNDVVALNKVTVLQQTVINTPTNFDWTGLLDMLTGNGADVVSLNGVITDGAAGIETTDDTSLDRNDVVTITNSTFFRNGPNYLLPPAQAGLFVDTGDGNDVVTIVRSKVTDAASVDTGNGADTVTINSLTADVDLFSLGAGNYDTLIVVNSFAFQEDFRGGGNTGDTLVLAHNNFDNPPTITGFQHVIGG